MKCPVKFPQILKDLAPFGNIDLKELAKEAVKRFGTNHALCHYSVINNKVCLQNTFAVIVCLSLQSVVFLVFFTLGIKYIRALYAQDQYLIFMFLMGNKHFKYFELLLAFADMYSMNTGLYTGEKFCRI